METKKISKNEWEIPKKKEMKVPVRIFASEKLLEKIKQDDSIKQGINVSTLPGIYGKSIMMPDAHQGYGFPIGGVAAFDVEKGCISPGGVGFDINCGVRLLTSKLDKNKVGPQIKELIEELFNQIPCGVGKDSSLRLNDGDFEEVLNNGLDWALKNKYATKDDLDRCEENGHMRTADASKVSPRARKRGRRQLGTLGAGNHFVDVMYVDEIYDKKVADIFGITKENQIVIMIHSGSRGLGHQVCSDYLRKMEDEFPEIIENLPDRNLTYSPTGSQLSKDYLGAMSAAANYGWCNRQLITYNTRLVFNKLFGKEGALGMVYDVAHNIVKVEEYEIDGEMKKVYVHRKGATRAFGPGHKEIPKVYRKVGQPIIIPGSMGTASYVLVGTDKAMNETFSSTPHGAGRVMSRHEANETFNEEEVKKDLVKKNIYLKSASKAGVVQEAPGVYKDIDEVVKITDEVGIGKKVAKLIPIGVING
jgi:tRNA-splicing ligase RtcB (3'-phosphate/5'-hydroxy nucleic acid ligase)